MISLLLGIAWPAEIPAGDGIDAAIAVQVSQAGLDEVAALVPSLLPPDAFVIDDMADLVGAPSICLGGSYEFSNISADLMINDVQLNALPGELELYLDLTVSLNDASDPFTMLIDAICLIDEDCSGWIEPFNLQIAAPITLEVVGPPGSRTLDSVVGDLDIVHDLDGSKLQTGCFLDDIEEVMNLFGLSIFDLVLGLFTGQLTELIEPTLDEALVATNIAGELDLLGAILAYRLEPSAVFHTGQGLEIHMASQFDGAQAECIADDDPGSSAATLSPVPDASGNPEGAHAAVHVSSDMINQALYAAWRGGGLCLEVGGEEAGLDLPIALDTSLLPLVGGDPFQELFPEPRPIEILIRPHAAPLAVTDGPNDIDLSLDEFELVFMGELDGRMARALGANIQADLGANVPYVDGVIGVELIVDPQSISASLSGDALVDGVEDKVRDDFPAFMGTLLDSLLPSLVGDTLAFEVPSFEGIGLLSLSIDASGADGDWLGAAATVGAVPIDPYAAGCGCDGTTTTSDCGCAASRSGTLSVVAWLVPLVWLRRRR